MRSPNRREAGDISVMDLLRDGDPRFERAEGPRTFSFPEDHGPHPTFRTEWWYVTGNLHTEESGHRFGFQLTFFRSALSPPPPTRTSAWATNNLNVSWRR